MVTRRVTGSRGATSAPRPRSFEPNTQKSSLTPLLHVGITPPFRLMYHWKRLCRASPGRRHPPVGRASARRRRSTCRPISTRRRRSSNNPWNSSLVTPTCRSPSPSSGAWPDHAIATDARTLGGALRPRPVLCAPVLWGIIIRTLEAPK